MIALSSFMPSLAARVSHPRGAVARILAVAACALAMQAHASGFSESAVQQFAQDVVRSADAAGRTFGVIDKPSATLWIFDAQGRPLANSPVLVGQAVGDVAPPDIGTRPLSKVKLHEKVTNAGRFVTEAGSNHKGEDIVWLDYDAALSMHRVRNVPGESRAKRLQTPTVADNRISFGCVNIPASFYDRYIDPLFSRSKGVVYVLPETKSVASVFPFASDSSQAVAQHGSSSAR